MSFDMPGNFTVDQKGTTDIRNTTTGSEKCNFTIILCITADSGKLPPMVIFKERLFQKKISQKGFSLKLTKKVGLIKKWCKF